MDLQERLDDYEVTAVPPRVPSLSLVWSEPVEMPEASPTEPEDGVDRGFALLDDYRITRIPGRAAS